MDIVVAMKQIPDLQQIRIRNREPVWDDAPLTFGNIDKNALETAVRLKEAMQGRVVVICVGTAELEDTVKEALAAGADEARLVIVEDPPESSISAILLAAAIKQMGPVDLIVMGEGSGDNYSSQVGSRVAQILGMAQVGYVSRVEMDGNDLVVTRSLEDCEEIIQVPCPALITVMADINSARIPSVTQILKAGKKPREILAAGQLVADLPDPAVNTLSNLAPEMQRRQIIKKSVPEMIRALQAEGFVGRD